MFRYFFCIAGYIIYKKHDVPYVQKTMKVIDKTRSLKISN